MNQGDPTHTEGKKIYRRPALRIYGEIEAITNASMTNGSNSDTRGDFNMDTRTH